MTIKELDKRLRDLEAKQAELDAQEPTVVFCIETGASAVTCNGQPYRRAEGEAFSDFCERIRADQTKDMKPGRYIHLMNCLTGGNNG